MNTYSHVFVALASERASRTQLSARLKTLPQMRIGALVVGSLIPDLMLTLIAVITITRDTITGALADFDFESTNTSMMSAKEIAKLPWTVQLFDIWFFENPWVIAAQQVFHSPLTLIVLIGIAYWFWKQNGSQRASWFFWMFCASMLHSIIDIPLHVDDGPLLLFPLNWELRYYSPISYWDWDYYGREWTIFEHALDLVLIIYLVWSYRHNLFGWLRRAKVEKK